MKKKKVIFGNKSSLSNKNQKKKNIGENDILKKLRQESPFPNPFPVVLNDKMPTAPSGKKGNGTNININISISKKLKGK